MFPVKSEPSDTFDVGYDLQRIMCMEDNPHFSKNLNTKTSENRPATSLSNEMLLTVAYVKNESISNTFDCKTSGHEGIHGQRLMDFNATTAEKTEVCTVNTSGNVTDEKQDTMHMKEESPHITILENHDINHMTATSQHYRIEDEEHVTMHVKEEWQHCYITEDAYLRLWQTYRNLIRSEMETMAQCM